MYRGASRELMKMFAESVGLVKAQLGLQSRATAFCWKKNKEVRGRPGVEEMH